MTHCNLLADALSTMRRGIDCRPAHDGRTLVVTTGRTYSDGDPVELLVRLQADDQLVVSDGGVTRARLDLIGVDLSPKPKALWAAITDDYGVIDDKGRVYVRGDIKSAAGLLTRLSDACIALDSVHLLSGGERHGFGEKLQKWLRSPEIGLAVRIGETVRDRYGDKQPITAVVESKRGDIYVQAAAGKDVGKLRPKIAQANWVMAELLVPVEQRLVVLEGVPADAGAVDRIRAWVKRLTEVSYVGTFDSQLPIDRFLKSQTPPPDRDFVTEAFGQIRM